MRKTITLLILLLFILSVSAQKILREEYILLYKDVAISEMKRTGIPASVKLAQAILESDNGNSKLAIKANNHFGIKCGSTWQGETITHNDDRQDECFRAYKTPEESYKDHSDFLANNARYKSLFNLNPTDYTGWSLGLKSAGYATSQNYTTKLIQIIEDNKLYIFDADTSALAEKTPPQKTSAFSIEENQFVMVDIYAVKGGKINNVDFICAKQGDTWQSLSDLYNKLPWELQSYNDIPKHFPPAIQEGQVIFLQPKRSKAAPQFEAHPIIKGETMWSISQQYGVKLSRLYKMNRMLEGSEPKAGEVIYLRKNKPKQ